MTVRKRLALLGVLLILAGGVTALDILMLYPDRLGEGKGVTRRVVVPKGVGPKGLTKLLDDAKLIDSPGRFYVWLRITGGISKVRSGEFELDDRLSPAMIVEKLSGRGIGKGTKVVLPEGSTLTGMGEALEAAGVMSKEAFVAAAMDAALVRELGSPGPTFEGYLFPDTYYFEPGTEPRAVIVKMHRKHKSELEAAGIPETADLKNLVTLASIVQAETPVIDEMPKVAGVYTNRLTSPDYPSRRLQADPTVSYGCEPFVHPRAPSCEAFNGVLRRRQLDDPANPYNTYQHPGLPPGPICAPGIDALKAAAKPEKGPFLFFVASRKKDGTHVFSTTLEEHQKAVQAYWEP